MTTQLARLAGINDISIKYFKYLEKGFLRTIHVISARRQSVRNSESWQNAEVSVSYSYTGRVTLTLATDQAWILIDDAIQLIQQRDKQGWSW